VDNFHRFQEVCTHFSGISKGSLRLDSRNKAEEKFQSPSSRKYAEYFRVIGKNTKGYWYIRKV